MKTRRGLDRGIGVVYGADFVLYNLVLGNIQEMRLESTMHGVGFHI